MNGKKILMIVASHGFRDEEYQNPRAVLEDTGVAVTVASSTTGEAKGMFGAVVKPDISIAQVRVDDFDGLVLVGGSGASEYWEDPAVHGLVREAYLAQKIVAAICIAPVTLAKAGILEGKKATVFPSQAGVLRSLRADYTGRDVEMDGNIITADGPDSAHHFGEAIARALLQ